MFIQPDYNMASFVCIIFSHGLTQKNSDCKKITNFLLSRARSRGYRGDIILVFQTVQNAHELVSQALDLSSYLCVNDFREIGLVGKNRRPLKLNGAGIRKQSGIDTTTGITVH